MSQIPLHGGQLRQLAARFSVPVENLLDFSANINPHGPSESLLTALREALVPSVVRDYPDSQYSSLKSAFASYAGVPSESLAVANGVIPLLDASLRATKVRRCLLPIPCFGEYQTVLERCGVQVVPFPLSPSEGFVVDANRVIASLEQESCDAILLGNPQNPSGVALEGTAMLELVEQVLRRGVHIFLDEAFIDYLPEESVSQVACSRSAMVVYRSVTKFFALAGMRVAFAVASPEVARRIQRYIPEWPVTTLAAQAAQLALGDNSFIDSALAQNACERAWLAGQLAELGLEVYPGRANFILFRVGKPWCGEELWKRLIQESGVVLRACGNFEGLDGQFLRTLVHRREENLRILQALRSALSSAM